MGIGDVYRHDFCLDMVDLNPYLLSESLKSISFFPECQEKNEIVKQCCQCNLDLPEQFALSSVFFSFYLQ